MDIKVPRDRVVYSSPFVKAELRFSPTLERQLNNTYGLYGPVQTYIDMTFMHGVRPYMPLDTGTLQGLMEIHTITGSGVNIVRAPQARYLYYGMLMVDSVTGSSWSPLGGKKVLTNKPLQFHGGGHSGPKWDERWAAMHKKAFIDSVQKFVDGGAKL